MPRLVQRLVLVEDEGDASGMPAVGFEDGGGGMELASGALDQD